MIPTSASESERRTGVVGAAAGASVDAALRGGGAGLGGAARGADGGMTTAALVTGWSGAGRYGAMKRTVGPVGVLDGCGADNVGALGVGAGGVTS
jgi:hypothetical protein